MLNSLQPGAHGSDINDHPCQTRCECKQSFGTRFERSFQLCTHGCFVISHLQADAPLLTCKACLAPLQADPEVIRGHALTHLTDLGLCNLCGASIADRAAGVAHALTHVGVQLLTCDMCHLQFCSHNKLLLHHRQAAASYTPPQTGGGRGPGAELQCAVCSKTLSKDFQVGIAGNG